MFLGQHDPEGIGARLERWCRGGSLGWVLDGEQDAIGLDAPALGFDMTDVLDHPPVRTPLMMYLFHRVEGLIDGRRMIIAIDEFWKALGDEAFRDLANDKLKTIRKQNGVMVFGTQSPRDALASPIAHTIVEQCPTQIFLPNARGKRADYVDGFHLTDTRIPPDQGGARARKPAIPGQAGPQLGRGGTRLSAASTTRSPCCPDGRKRSSFSTAFGPRSATIRPHGCRCFSGAEKELRHDGSVSG